MASRAFVSFEMEDRWARDFLAQHARDKRIPFEFLDYSIKEPFESKWKTNARARIGITKGTIVLIGPSTARADAVLWEINETLRQGHPLFGIQINKDRTYQTPAGVSRVVRWNFQMIAAELARW
ncbi:MAG TPA: TIR domain-containing protein [Solirubrobacterales bacterium]|nr:TIR domain-containing protein [Solirubrobacterales bacterium]